MKNRTIFLKIALFITLLFLFISALVMPQYSNGYNASIVDKYNRLQSIDECKIILVGDSNVAFGFDSKRIEEAFGMPVVNFGLHGGLGQTFHTDMIKTNIHEGDIIIIAPGDYSINYAGITDCVLAWTTIENDYRLISNISAKDYKNMALAYPTYLKRAIELFVNGYGNQDSATVYSRSAFNEHGDNVFPRTECHITEENKGFNSHQLSEEIRAYWNTYNEFVLSKNAILFMSSPPILSNTLTVDLNALQSQLETNLDFPVISQLVDYVYPIEYFYNTGFHLNDVGKAIRTEQLIVDLSIALKNI